MKNRISTGALFAMLMLMAMLPRTGHSQEIDPNAYYEIVSSNNLVLDNQDSEDDGTQIFINNRVENRVSQVWQLTTPGYGVYKICTPLSDKCVDNNNTKEPGPVIQWDNGATNMNQFWKLTKIGGNTYTFTNITNGLNLGISDDGQPGKAALQLVADSTVPDNTGHYAGQTSKLTRRPCAVPVTRIGRTKLSSLSTRSRGIRLMSPSLPWKA